MDLLKLMLEKEPDKRISSRDALDHAAFHMVLSKSPLILRNPFNADNLLKHQKLVEELFKKQKPQKWGSIFGEELQNTRPH